MVLLWTGVGHQNFPERLNGYLSLSCQGVHWRHIFLEIICTARLKHYWGHKFKEVHGTVDRFWQDSKRAYLSMNGETHEYHLYYCVEVYRRI